MMEPTVTRQDIALLRTEMRSQLDHLNSMHELKIAFMETKFVIAHQGLLLQMDIDRIFREYDQRMARKIVLFGILNFVGCLAIFKFFV